MPSPIYIPYVGPPNTGIWELHQQATDVQGNEWLCQKRGFAGQPGGAEFLEMSAAATAAGSVSSVFGRTGVVVATTGDYTAAQVTNAADTSAASVVFSGTISTAPSGSASVAVTLGTPVHNTLGYDAMLVVFVKVTAATSATILAGTSSSATPSVNPYVQSDSLTGVTSIPLYVPSNYYAVVSTQGTITATATGMWCPV